MKKPRLLLINRVLSYDFFEEKQKSLEVSCGPSKTTKLSLAAVTPVAEVYFQT
jgi:hypothetical protein